MMKSGMPIFHLSHQNIAKVFGRQRFATEHCFCRHAHLSTARLNSSSGSKRSRSSSRQTENLAVFKRNSIPRSLFAVVEPELVRIAGDLHPVAVGIEKTDGPIPSHDQGLRTANNGNLAPP